MKAPKITLITCTYYRPDLLRRAIQSVQKQTLQDYEHLIISDHCPFAEHVYNDFKEDTRIRFFKTPDPYIYNLGACAFNKGIKEAKSEYISYLLDDDILFPNHLEEHYQQLINGDTWGHSNMDNVVFESPHNNVKNILSYSYKELQAKAYIRRKQDGPKPQNYDVGALCHKKNIDTKWIPQCECSGWEDTVFMNGLGVNKKRGEYTMIKLNWGGIHRKNTKGLDSEYYDILTSKLTEDSTHYSGYRLNAKTPYAYPELKNKLYE